MTEYRKFTTTGRLGITDLKSEYPYYNAHDWPVWNPAFEDVTKESYEADIPGYEQRVREWNEEYIAKLKASGEYGQTFQRHFNFMVHPEFDAPQKQVFTDFKIVFPKGHGKDLEIPKFGLKHDNEEEE